MTAEAETTPTPTETDKEEQAPETPEVEKTGELTEEAPKKSILATMCGCISGEKKAAAVKEKVDETKKDEIAEKEEEAEAPVGEDAEASA